MHGQFTSLLWMGDWNFIWQGFISHLCFPIETNYQHKKRKLTTNKTCLGNITVRNQTHHTKNNLVLALADIVCVQLQ